jgi:hypothetical protein
MALAPTLSTGRNIRRADVHIRRADVHIGSAAVADIVLAHRVTDLSVRLAMSRRRAVSCGGRRAVAHTTDDSSRDIPKGGPRAVGFASHPE